MNSLMSVETNTTVDGEIDLVEEMRLRTWARKNYAAACDRDESWHPVIHDEMDRMEIESHSS